MATLDASIWLLLKQKADTELIHDKFTFFYRPDQQLDYVWLFLYYATQAGHTQVVTSIMDRTFPYLNDLCHVLDKETLVRCLNEAVRKVNVDMIRVFLDRQPELCATVGNFYVADNRFNLAYSPIELAIHQENIAALDILLEYYSGQVVGVDQQNALHKAAKYPSSKAMNLLLSNEKCLRGINHYDEHGWTPLLLAAMYHPEAIPSLLQHGADTSASVRKHGNALQILSNWSIKDRPSRPSDDDPVPTLARRLTLMNASNDTVYIPAEFVSIATALVDNGVDVDAESLDQPLRAFAKNIERRLGEVRGAKHVRDMFRDGMAYLAGVSQQRTRDAALLDLCSLVNFIGTQLRRSHDYDNISGYIDLLPFIRDLIIILLDKGANADVRLAADTGQKKIRSFQYILPFSNPCAASLKTLIVSEYTDQSECDRFISPLDIILTAVTNMYFLQSHEPELHEQAIITVRDIISILTRSGSHCVQIIHLFVCLAIDPMVVVPILHQYLECLSQERYHQVLMRMLSYIESVPSEQSANYSNLKHHITDCQNRMYSLKELLRRDIIALLGGRQQAHHIEQLPLPQALKSYMTSCWD